MSKFLGKREFLRLLGSAAVAAPTALVASRTTAPHAPTDDHAASTYAKIMKSRTIRCGYLVYSPYIRRDPNTGELSGIFFDIMEQIGKNAGLTIRWTEEVGYENIFTALDSQRFDIFCGGLWPNATRALMGSFSSPAFYSTVVAWVRADDERIHKLDDLRKTKARIAVIDGAMEDLIARADYADLPRVSLPTLSPFNLNFQNIIGKKADVTFAEPSSVAEFLRSNPGTLRSLGESQPLRVFGNALVVRKSDEDTKEFLDLAMQELVYSGQMDRILARYEITPNAFPRVALPYKEAER